MKREVAPARKKRKKEEEEGKKRKKKGEGRSKRKKSSKRMTSRSEMAKFGSRKEPIPDCTEQYLYLLEFYVSHVTGERLAKLNRMFFVPTSVSFQFLNFAEEKGKVEGDKDDDFNKEDERIEVTPVDPMFEPLAGIGDNIEYFYSGKSVLFGMDRKATTDKLLELLVRMLVRKRMPRSIKPDVIVGEGCFELTKQFAALRKEMLQCWHEQVPPAKSYEGNIPLYHNDRQVGTIEVRVRMSAYGGAIVTEFTAPSYGIQTYVFKGDKTSREKSLAYECRIVEDDRLWSELESDEQPCPRCIPRPYPCTPCGRKTGARLAADLALQPVVSAPASEISQADDDRCNAPVTATQSVVRPCGKAVVLKVSGLLDTGGDRARKPTVTVAPESEATRTECSTDPEHDVFVLRIGKKGLVGDGEKSDLQLEMRTPKGPERRPPIRCETREMQTEHGAKSREEKARKRKKR